MRSNHEDNVHYTHIHNGGYLPISPASHANTYDAYLVYHKGADMVHTMRGYLGDSLFFKGLKYVQLNNPFTDVSSMKFRDDMTFATGVNMNDFFDGWVFNGGWPQFSVDSFSSVANGGNYDVTVHIRQRLDGAPKYFNNVPIEITFKDANWNEAVKTITVSGKSTTATVTIPVNPVFAGMDLDEKISDAITSDMKVIKTTGASFNTVSNGRMSITVQAITANDSAFLFVEHNYAAPDSFKTPNPNYKLSPYHYWKVSGILPTLFDATGTIMYDGRTTCTSGGACWLDDQLLTATNQEDSIALLYRKNTADDWKLFPYYTKTMGNLSDKTGTIKIDSLLLGEYSLAFAYVISNAVEENNFDNSISVYPNPSNGAFELRIANWQNCGLKIYNTLGQIVHQAEIHNPKFEIDLREAPSGIYFLQVKTCRSVTVKKIVKQ